MWHFEEQHLVHLFMYVAVWSCVSLFLLHRLISGLCALSFSVVSKSETRQSELNQNKTFLLAQCNLQ